MNRLVTDSLAGLLLCSTEASIENLRREGAGERSRLVGDVMTDVARVFGPIAERRSTILERLSLRPRSYALATVHRQQNVDDDEALAQAVSVLNRIAEAMPVLLPAHPREPPPSSGEPASSPRWPRGSPCSSPLGYLDFGNLLRNASAVVTDSGGVQKEAYLAAVPCLTLRERTEWVETVRGWLEPARRPRSRQGRGRSRRARRRQRRGYAPSRSVRGRPRGGRVAEAVASWIAGDEEDRRG